MGDGDKDFPQRFAEVAHVLDKEPGVTFGQPGAKKTFGHSALKVHDKIFAMVSSSGDFVVKLPAQRVEVLETAGAGKRFQSGNGAMREWLAVDGGQDWLKLAREALHFVRTVP